MKCLRCGNRKTFHHFTTAMEDHVIEYNADDEDLIEDRDLKESIPAGTVTVQCDRCEFESLPIVFGGHSQFLNLGSLGWPEVRLEENGEWYIPNAFIKLDTIMIKGRGYLGNIGETYAKLRAIRHSASIDELPEYLADGATEVRNFALERKAKIEEGQSAC